MTVRRLALVLALLPAGCSSASEPPVAQAPPAAPALDVAELSAVEARRRMDGGTLTARALTDAYLARIAAIDKAGPTLNSVIEVNPAAVADADRLDAERAAGKVRGSMHGIPVLLKDNIDAVGMVNSAGSLALADHRPSTDAFLVARLRAAGAVILGKTNLSEWANFRSTRSTSGWSGRGGQTRNPYVLDRNPCGSSSGTGAAIAASLATVGIGTETDGSIICPSSICGLVGIKPTVGLVSRSGIIPISVTQDTAGPMARTVADAAALLGVMVGEDARDAATQSRPGGVVDYTAALDRRALSGARIGVARNMAGFHPLVDAAFEQAIVALRAAGAVIVDPADVPTVNRTDDPELEVLLYEFKDGLNAYLASRGATSRMKTLADIIDFNTSNASREMPWFGQEQLERAQAKGSLADAAYRDALAACRRLSRTEGLDVVLATHKVDAIVAPSNGPSWPIDLLSGDRYTGGNSSVASVAGYPSITVPMGFVGPLPVGFSFIGGAWSEPRLIALAYAFEQATNARRAPRFLSTASFAR